MANSANLCIGVHNDHPSNFLRHNTPGPWGINDAGDPNAWSTLGDTAGPMGFNDFGAPTLSHALWCDLHNLRILPKSQTAPPVADTPDTLLLAAVAFGESSTKNVYEEMAAIASVIVRMGDARGLAMAKLLGPKSTYAFAASDGNPRVAAFRKASDDDRATGPMSLALKAARNALSGGTDYSNGAYFWDGYDLKTNYARHKTALKGFHFTDPAHNIMGLTESSVSVTTYWQEMKEGKLVDTTKVRGKYTYTFESTAAWGGTIFWKYGKDFLKATGNKIYN